MQRSPQSSQASTAILLSDVARRVVCDLLTQSRRVLTRRHATLLPMVAASRYVSGFRRPHGSFLLVTTDFSGPGPSDRTYLSMSHDSHPTRPTSEQCSPAMLHAQRLGAFKYSTVSVLLDALLGGHQPVVGNRSATSIRQDYGTIPSFRGPLEFVRSVSKNLKSPYS